MATHPEAFCAVGTAPTPPRASRPEPSVVHLGGSGSSEAERAVANIKAADHVCLLRTRGTGDAVSPLATFVRLGLQSHERVVCVVEAATAGQLAAHWQRLGVDIDDASARGQFELLTRDQWQAHELDSFRKAQRVRRLVREAQEAGYAGIRIVLEMTCALAADTAARRVAEWGATINTLLLAEYPMRMLCDYDRERLPPEIIVAALQVHPLVLVRGELCANMFYQAALSTGGDDAAALTEPAPPADNPARQVEWMIEQLRQFRAVERERSAMRRRRVLSTDAATAQGRLDQVIEAMSDGFLLFDAAGVITECNAAAERLLGRERSLVIGREWPEAYPEMTGSLMQLHLQEPFRAERGATFEYTHLGTARTLEVKMALGLDGSTTFLLHDLTDRKLLEAELRRHEQPGRRI